MKLTHFYDVDTTTEWFTMGGRDKCVHEKLGENNFRIIDKENLAQECEDIEVPVSMATMSWGGRIARPRNVTANTFIAKQLYDLQHDKYQSEILAEILSAWMQQKLTGTKYLVSLNPKHYLVAMSNEISFDDVFTVSRTWSIDCYLGVFDESGSNSFIFDAEFFTTMISCDPEDSSNDMQSFSQFYNAEFKETFIRDNHLLSHADPDRAQEYFEKIFMASI